MREIKTNRGFAVFRVLAVVTILGAIAAIVISRMSATHATANAKARDHRREINAAVERYYIDHNAWPANDLSDISANAKYFPASMPRNSQDGSAYTLNATTHRVD